MTSAPEDRLGGFWLRWVAANCVAELVGLGAVAGVSAWLVVRYGGGDAAAGALAFAALSLVLGALEGAVVGQAQSWVLRRRVPDLRGWVAATVLGAVLAWALGMLPSTVAAIVPDPPPADPSPGISDSLQLALAAPLGFVAGAVLGFPQARVLRRHARAPARWVLANALAWTAAMPLVFAAAGLAYELEGVSARVLAVSLGLALAGAVVGAVHGAFLVRWLRLRLREATEV